jgi:heat shock protein HslJ
MILAAGCSETHPPTAETGAGRDSVVPSAEELAPAARAKLPVGLEGPWVLVALDGRPVPEVGNTPILEIHGDGGVAGNAGVNRFRTTIEIDAGRLTFAPAAATKMAGPPEAMALENSFLDRLGSVDAYQLEGATLRLWTAGEEALTFTRAED